MDSTSLSVFCLVAVITLRMAIGWTAPRLKPVQGSTIYMLGSNKKLAWHHREYSTK
jgi:hypothetical protein